MTWNRGEAASLTNYDSRMELYGQNAELRLLAKLVGHLDSLTMVDVGAERGGFTQEMLVAGVTHVHAFEPNADNTQALRASFESDRRVNIHPCAISDDDG